MDTLTGEEIPEMLREIPDSPTKLYIQGKLPGPNTKFLCVVGSRKYTPYGKEACEKLITGLRGYDIAIVSGLALGIDGIAHKSALDAGLNTIAVPGSGLDESILYPSTHRRLAENILDAGGALLSEFEPSYDSLYVKEIISPERSTLFSAGYLSHMFDKDIMDETNNIDINDLL